MSCQCVFFFFSSRRRHTRFDCDWSSDVCSSDLAAVRLRAGVGAVTAETLVEKIRQLSTQGRPDIVHIVEQIPMTTWHRPTIHGLPGATAQSADRSAAIDS